MSNIAIKYEDDKGNSLCLYLNNINIDEFDKFAFENLFEKTVIKLLSSLLNTILLMKSTIPKKSIACQIIKKFL